MEASVYLPMVGRASKCEVSDSHRPEPMRYIWHHVLPKTCGGRSVSANLVALCDNCHFGVHALLYQMKVNGIVTQSSINNRARVKLAIQGYQAAVVAGTVDKIPNEGSAVL